MTLALLLGFALLPLLPLSAISRRQMARVRDMWQLAVLWLLVVYLALHGPYWGAPIAAWFAWHWRAPAGQPWRYQGPLIGWAAAVLTWEAARWLPGWAAGRVVQGWLGLAVVEVALMTLQWCRLVPHPKHQGYAGTFGQRTFAAAFLALLVPFAPWWFLPVLGWGLWMNLSGVTMAALVIGWPVVGGPWWLAASLGALAATAAGGWVVGAPYYPSPEWRKRVWRLLDKTSHGPSMDGLTWRWGALRMAWETWPWQQGSGPTSFYDVVRRWYAAVGLEGGDLHCDPAQLAYEYGWLGALAVGLAAFHVAHGLRWGDPWSAAAVIGAVCCLGSFPLRIAPTGVVLCLIWARVAG